MGLISLYPSIVDGKTLFLNTLSLDCVLLSDFEVECFRGMGVGIKVHDGVNKKRNEELFNKVETRVDLTLKARDYLGVDVNLITEITAVALSQLKGGLNFKDVLEHIFVSRTSYVESVISVLVAEIITALRVCTET